MFFKKNKINYFKKFKNFKILIIIPFFILTFILGAYAHKSHFFYTFVKPVIFQNIKFLNKFVQGKIQEVDKVYLNIDFEVLKELNDRKEFFLKEQAILNKYNEWLDISIIFNNKKYNSKIRFKGRDPETHLNASMRNKNVSYKIKIKKNEKGNILGLREFNLMDLRRRGYILEWYARKFLENEGLIFLDYKFIQLFINGEDHGIYAMDETISEATYTRNKRRDSVSVRVDNNYVTSNVDLSFTNPTNAGFNNVYLTAEIDTLNETIENKYKILSNISEFNQKYPIELNEKIFLEPDKKRLKYYITAYNLFENFRKDLMKVDEVFDLDQLARGFAASDILDGWHGINWTNLSFYFNPITLKLEPIFQDWYNEGFISRGNEELQRKIRFLDIYNYGLFYKNIFSSKKFLEKYIYYLEKYTSNDYLTKFNSKIKNEFQTNLKKIYKSSPYYEFPYDLFERKKDDITNFIYHYDPIHLTLWSTDVLIDEEKTLSRKKKNTKTTLRLGNNHVLPITLNKLILEGFESQKFEKSINIEIEPRNLIAFSTLKFEKSPVKYKLVDFKTPDFNKYKKIVVEYTVNGSKKKFLKEILNPIEYSQFEKNKLNNFLIDEKNQSNLNITKFIEIYGDIYEMKIGTWNISEDLVIPSGKKLIISEGTRIILENNARIISKSPIIAKGTKNNKIYFESKKKYPGQCIIILGSNNQQSFFENVVFDGLQNCNMGSIYSEGALNIFKSEIVMKNIFFRNNVSGDDGINLINSNFKIENITLENILKDGIDLDFSMGNINNITCMKCGNDGVDLSNTTLKLQNYNGSNIGDKGISVGENSILNASNVYIDSAEIGIAIKDGSKAEINNVSIKNSNFPITSYIKKQEFGPANLNVSSLLLKNNINPILIEEGTLYRFDKENYNEVIKNDLFKSLYPSASYKNF